MTGGDMAFVDELVDTYLEDGASQLAALRTAADAGSAEALGRPAHSLKSSSLNVGALELGSLCRALEEASRGGLVPDAAEDVAAIAESFDATRTALLGERASRAAS